EERRKRILDAASGFVYLISLEGVTGAREYLPAGIAASIRSLQRLSSLPVAVGFGISKPEHVRALCTAGADAVVVGSAITQVIEEHMGDKEAIVREVHAYVSGLCAARRRDQDAGGCDGEEGRVPG
ncbi:MAG: tryptophan synthase subunit alpha, partial [Methanomicrobiaceae archaeon]|nr:tryptophan synthase subunit alpha [Methanomicrobiaceae archaeon]